MKFEGRLPGFWLLERRALLTGEPGSAVSRVRDTLLYQPDKNENWLPVHRPLHLIQILPRYPMKHTMAINLPYKINTKYGLTKGTKVTGPHLVGKADKLVDVPLMAGSIYAAYAGVKSIHGPRNVIPI